ncbi:hypothetical protein [Deinococcus aestuarii]|uniref:hypothetical protein n=1 Tax=Deinococcus aestuarii TaxID=2774531 RepID=UPI001C0CDA42|nr:hypothetical protein [Deinococcus aestuarii]
MTGPAPTFWEMSEGEYLRTEPDSAESWTDRELSVNGEIVVPGLNTTLTLDDIYAGVFGR